jgi:Mg-chelatase subunit ChlD
MKSKILALALFGFTVASVAFYPAYQSIGAINTAAQTTAAVNPLNQQRSTIDVVFVLDTTGSMSGLIQAAKEKIWSIASTMASAQSAPEIRMGLVAYRDRGDAYVTKVLDLSDDLDSMYARLMDFQADGGGDGPESVNQALHDAVHSMSWSQDQNAYKVVFLVGDAPPHMDYQDDVKYPDTLAAAVKKGIVVNAIQSGQNQVTTTGWQQIAQLGQGRYFQVAQAGDAVAIATPFDKKIAVLSEKLDHTRLYYGDAEEKEKQQSKVDATDKLHATSSFASRARRAAFNTSKSGEANFLGEGELVDDIASGRVELADIEQDQLPEAIKAMAPAQQKALIKETAHRRNELQQQIGELSEKRSDFLKKKVEEAGGARDSLDEKIYSAIREQAGKKGLHYKADAAAY